MTARIPARIVARVYHDPSDSNPYPWFYTIDAYPLDEPENHDDPAVIDFGSVETREDAWAAVSHALTHRDQFDLPELVHVRADKRPAYTGVTR